MKAIITKKEDKYIISDNKTIMLADDIELTEEVLEDIKRKIVKGDTDIGNNCGEPKNTVEELFCRYKKLFSY